MKSFLILFLAGISSFFCLSADAQTHEPQEEIFYDATKAETPKWVSEKGYWVIKSNKKTPKESIIYFYNNEHNLVYQEEIKDRKLKLRKKTLMKLKTALEEAVASYEKGVWASRTQLVKQHLD